MNKFLHMPDGSRLSLPIWFPSTFVMNEVCLEREEDRLSSVPSNPSNLLSRCCPEAGNSKAMGIGLCLARSFFPLCKPWNEGIVHCPHACGKESRAPSQMAEERNHPQKRRKLVVKKCTQAARLFGLFCFLRLEGCSFPLWRNNVSN